MVLQKAVNQPLRYATVCVTLSPEEMSEGFLRKVLSIAAKKLGSGDVRLASHLMLILNVSFDRRDGFLPPDVLLLKNSEVLHRAGEAKASDEE